MGLSSCMWEGVGVEVEDWKVLGKSAGTPAPASKGKGGGQGPAS